MGAHRPKGGKSLALRRVPALAQRLVGPSASATFLPDRDEGEAQVTHGVENGVQLCLVFEQAAHHGLAASFRLDVGEGQIREPVLPAFVDDVLDYDLDFEPPSR